MIARLVAVCLQCMYACSLLLGQVRWEYSDLAPWLTCFLCRRCRCKDSIRCAEAFFQETQQSASSEFPNTISPKCDQPLKNSNSLERKPLLHRKSVAQLMMPSQVVTDNVTIYKIVWAQALALRCSDGVVCHGITYVNLKEGRSFLGDANWLLLIRSKRYAPI